MTIDIKCASYKQFGMIRRALEKERLNLWQKLLKDHPKLRKLSFQEIGKVNQEFMTQKNQFTDEGIINILLMQLEDIETELKKEFNK